ncbi:hypothetical protein FNV43_RR20863 [Rhamnella rubrinervis]|uniref:Uncharacterized protein n=1 Tax=Rhamnella rubrinervis TaxID=2594499 RepID=A0A8K0DV72_9ROSA|nr:hypothetical protein FNV43_RR20863 [Rhamnella rubrinervis]
MAMVVRDVVGKLLFFNMQVRVVKEAVDVSDPICWETRSKVRDSVGLRSTPSRLPREASRTSLVSLPTVIFMTFAPLSSDVNKREKSKGMDDEREIEISLSGWNNKNPADRLFVISCFIAGLVGILTIAYTAFQWRRNINLSWMKAIVSSSPQLLFYCTQGLSSASAKYGLAIQSSCLDPRPGSPIQKVGSMLTLMPLTKTMIWLWLSGTRWLLSTYFLSCTSSPEAEVKAPKCAWKIVFWNVYACKLVREVLGVSDRICWETRYDILSLRRSFSRPDWLLEWSPRETNVLADLAAKFSLVNGCNI